MHVTIAETPRTPEPSFAKFSTSDCSTEARFVSVYEIASIYSGTPRE
jgi:hypothetical protein